MLKKFFLLMKKIILGILFIYGFNMIIFPLNICVSINLFSILVVTLFGLPGVVGLCLFSIFMF